MSKSIRQPGRRKIDLSDESSAEVLKKGKGLIRSDWGGQDPDEQIKKKALEEGLDLGPQTRKFIEKEVTRQIESCRKRINHRIDEVIRRLEKDDTKSKIIESSP